MKKESIRITYRLVAWLIRSVFKIFFGLRIEGAENVPRSGRLIVVGNHISNFDPPVYGCALPREVFFAAKVQLFKGILGPIIRHLNAIPVKRSGSDKEAIKILTDKLKEDRAVLIFPEGTRSRDPNVEMEPKAGVGMLAVMADADLLPMRIDGSHMIESGWKGIRSILFKKGGISVKFGTVIHLDEVLTNDIPKKEAYHVIAHDVMKQIRELRE